MPTLAPVLDRDQLIAWYQRNRTRSKALFDLVADEAYYSRPIAQRHPLVFYEGHLPAFSFNTLVRRGLGEPDIDEALQRLFARGIDPSEADRNPAEAFRWPSRAVVRQFADEADRRVLAALERAELDQPGHPLLDRAEAAFAVLEHEAMHQETLLYMWHRLPFDQKRRPAGYQPLTSGRVVAQEWIEVPRGCATLGVARDRTPFGWDNEFPACEQDVDAFAIERPDTTNAAFLDFVEAGGYADPQWWRPQDCTWIQREALSHPLFWEHSDGRWHWRGMFELI